MSIEDSLYYLQGSCLIWCNNTIKYDSEIFATLDIELYTANYNPLNTSKSFMNRNILTRVSIAILLIGGVVGMGIHYEIESGAHYPYPDSTDLKTSPNSYTSTQVFVFGTVKEINQDTARIRIDSGQGSFTAEVTKFSTQRNVQTGGIVQVFGTFQGEYIIEADTVRVVNPSGASNIYKYIVSGIAAVLILVAFFQYWQVNIRSLSFEGK